MSAHPTGTQSGTQLAPGTTSSRTLRKHSEVTVTWREDRGAWYYRVMIDGQRHQRSTGVTQHSAAGRRTALRKATEIATALRGKDDMALAAAVRRPGFATCGEIAESYRQHGPAKSSTKTISRFASYVRDVTGRQDWAAQSSHLVLTPEALRSWISRQEAAGRSPAGIHTDVQTIKSIVAARRSHHLAELQLPDLAPFRAVTGGSSRTEGYLPIPRDTLRRMDRAAHIPLRRRDPRTWAAYWLMRKCGLRNTEVAALRREWIDPQPDGSADLILRPSEWIERDPHGTPTKHTWKPKGRSGRVPISGRLLRLLQAALGPDGDHLIPRAHETEAYDITHRALNAFVRPFLPDREKGAYTLRQEFGAAIAARDGIEVASRLLRHMDIGTTYRHYHNLIARPKPL